MCGRPSTSPTCSKTCCPPVGAPISSSRRAPITGWRRSSCAGFRGFHVLTESATSAPSPLRGGLGRVGEGVGLAEHRRTPTPDPSPQGGGEQESADPLDSERLYEKIREAGPFASLPLVGRD